MINVKEEKLEVTVQLSLEGGKNMKSKLKKSLAFLLAFVMVFTIVGVQLPVTASAETKIALSCKTKRVAIGGT